MLNWEGGKIGDCRECFDSIKSLNVILAECNWMQGVSAHQ